MSRVTEQEKQQVAKDLKEKLRLEAIFEPEIKKLFKRILNAFRISVVKTGLPVDSASFKDDWQELITNHHKRVQRAFKKPQKQANGEEEDLLLLALLAWVEQNSADSAEQRVSTDQKDMNAALTQAKELIVEQDLPTDNRTLAATATALLLRKLGGRLEGIKSFETQAAAESTKLSVAEIEAGLDPSVLSGVIVAPGVLSKKKWVTMGDSKVRVRPFNHRAANGQLKLITEFFEVSGELLKHPGDKSMGASIGNTINCRCSAVYQIGG